MARMLGSGIEVECKHCQARFAAPPSMKGGLSNCPDCGKATEVPGGPEALFWILLLSAIVAVLGLAGLVYAFSTPEIALGTLIFGAVIITVALVAS